MRYGWSSFSTKYKQHIRYPLNCSTNVRLSHLEYHKSTYFDISLSNYLHEMSYHVSKYSMNLLKRLLNKHVIRHLTSIVFVD